jgi:hypothetical protein
VAVAAAIAIRFAVEAVEVVFRSMIGPVSRVRTVVTVVRVEVLVYPAVEAVGTVEPGTGSDKDAIGKPLRAVVAVGRAVIG